MRRRVTAQKIRESRHHRHQNSGWFRRDMGWISILSLCVLMIGGIIFWASGFSGYTLDKILFTYEKATQRMGFVVEDIVIDGRERVLKENVLNALDIKWGDPLSMFNPWKAKEKLEQNPWIRSAIVERRLPATILIKLTERRPVARWQHQKQIDLIDETGTVIPLAPSSSQKRKNTVASTLPEMDVEFLSLPLFVGEGAPEKSPEFLQTVNLYPELSRRVTASSLINQRRWTIYLDKTIEIRLPEDGLSEAFEALSNLETQGLLTSRDVRVVDLRFLPQVIIRPTQEISTQKQSSPPGEDVLSLPISPKKGKNI
jgi:cell division protein FtsQ